MSEKKHLSEEELKCANGGENRGIQRVCPHCTQTYWTFDCKHDGLKVLCPKCEGVVEIRTI